MKQILTVLLILLGAAAQAQEDNARAFLGNDVFSAGYRLTVDESGADDAFIAGNTIEIQAALTGSALIAGQKISIDAPVAGDVYAMGQDISLAGSVGGDATLLGQDISSQTVTGDLRATGETVKVEGDVGGYAFVAGQDVWIGGSIAGDLHLAAAEVVFADGVVIGGTLHVYEEPDHTLELPAGLSTQGDVERHMVEDFPEGPSFGAVLKGFLSGVLFVAIVAAGIAAIAPQRLAEMRAGLLARPFASIWTGFLGLSVVLGAALVSAMTLVGLILVPVLLAIAGIGAFLGYVIGAYSVGVGMRLLAGLPEPDTLGARAVAALIGALSAAIIALAPFIGWLFVLALTISGIGSLIEHLFRPKFFAD